MQLPQETAPEPLETTFPVRHRAPLTNECLRSQSRGVTGVVVSGSRLASGTDAGEQRAEVARAAMALAQVSLWAICVLRVALATIFFQEEFLDGGESYGGCWLVSTVRFLDPVHFATLTLLSPHRALEEPLGAVYQ